MVYHFQSYEVFKDCKDIFESFYDKYVITGEHCELGHEAVGAKGNCHACSNRVTLCGVNDFGCAHPELLEYWDSNYNPHSVYAKSNKKFTWRCKAGHKWSAPVISITKGSNCKTCSIEIIKASRKEKRTLKDISHELDFKLVNESLMDIIASSSHERLTWLCNFGHEFKQSPNRIKNAKCDVCLNRRLLPGINDLLSKSPKLASELINSNDAKRMVNDATAVQWCKKCNEHEKAHIWKASIQSRYFFKTDCQICSGNQLQKDVNDFGSLLKTLNKTGQNLQWSAKNSFELDSITRGSNKTIIVECLNHSWPYEIVRAAKSFGNNSIECIDCRPKNYASKAEDELYDFLKQEFSKLSIERNVRRFKKFKVHEIDLLVNEFLAIDFNGSYWHTEGVFKPYGFHEAKSKAIKELGLIEHVIDEEDWLNNKEKVLTRLKAVVIATFKDCVMLGGDES